MVFAGKNLPSTILFKNFDGTGVLILPSENKIQKFPTPKIPTPKFLTPKIGFSQLLCGFRQFANCRYSGPATPDCCKQNGSIPGRRAAFLPAQFCAVNPLRAKLPVRHRPGSLPITSQTDTPSQVSLSIRHKSDCKSIPGQRNN